MIRTYSEMVKFDTFLDRFKYLSLDGEVGKDTFGYARYLNQYFYTTKEWINFRNKIIVRDNSCDLGIEDRPIRRRLVIHHINPITKEQILDRDPILLDPENVITTQMYPTHEAIHYGTEELLTPNKFEERKPMDTSPWRCK